MLEILKGLQACEGNRRLLAIQVLPFPALPSGGPPPTTILSAADNFLQEGKGKIAA